MSFVRPAEMKLQPKPGRHDLLSNRSPKGQVYMRNAITGEVVILAEGSPELAKLRRERDALNGFRPLWVQVAKPSKRRV